MKSVLITGASKGIGRYIALKLSKKHNVINLSRTPLNKKKNIKNILADISNYKILKKELSKLKKLDVLINNAGVTYHKKKNEVENFENIIKINLFGAFYCANILIPLLKKSKKNPVIINIASINAHQAFPKNPGYVSSKGGLVSLTRSLALDYGKYGIRSVSISPGYINSGIAKKSFKNIFLKKEREKRTILKRFGNNEDLLGIIELLISNKSKYITGQDIVIDGGWLAKGL
jgi:gluconate 5-dehydrogenase